MKSKEMTKENWKQSRIFDEKYLGEIEIERGGSFHIIETPTRLVFGGACNVGFIESGFMRKEGGESSGDALSELLCELETFYCDGESYATRLVCNERM